jgi:hypothetical protein
MEQSGLGARRRPLEITSNMISQQFLVISLIVVDREIDCVASLSIGSPFTTTR